MTQLPSRAPLSDGVICTLPPVKVGRAIIRDSGLSQLALLIGPRSRTWYLHATVHRRTHRLRLGPWPVVTTDDARDKCLAALRCIWRGERVKAERPATAPTLSTVLTEYLAARKLGTQAGADLRSVIRKHAGDWAEGPIDTIDARDVAKRYRSIAAEQPAQANRLLGALSALTRYAHAAHGVGDAGLVQRVRALLGGTEQLEARHVVIPDALHATWCRATDLESPQVARYFKALLLTGMRANELRRLPCTGWDSAAGVVMVARTKNGKPHALPVGPALRKLLDEEASAATVIRVRGGGSADDERRLFDIPEKVYRAACGRIGTAIGVDWHLHDLRRTFATVATRCGVDGATVKRLMNHATTGDVTAKHYVQRTVDDLRPAMQTIEAQFVSLWAKAT